MIVNELNRMELLSVYWLDVDSSWWTRSVFSWTLICFPISWDTMANTEFSRRNNEGAQWNERDARMVSSVIMTYSRLYYLFRLDGIIYLDDESDVMLSSLVRQSRSSSIRISASRPFLPKLCGRWVLSFASALFSPRQSTFLGRTRTRRFLSSSSRTTTSHVN